LPSTFGIESGAEVADQMLKTASPFTAIFAVNDNTAIGALSAIHRAGLRVAHDISVVGYNDIPLVSLLSVPLTTVRVPFHQIATNALDLLLRPNDENMVKKATPALIPRKTTTHCRNSEIT
jgi:LacI family transcriptional regulator